MVRNLRKIVEMTILSKGFIQNWSAHQTRVLEALDCRLQMVRFGFLFDLGPKEKAETVLARQEADEKA